MLLSARFRRRRGWLVPALLSVLVHGLAILAFWAVSEHRRPEPLATPLDTRIRGVKLESFVMERDIPVVLPHVDPPPRPQTTPSNAESRDRQGAAPPPLPDGRGSDSPGPDPGALGGSGTSTGNDGTISFFQVATRAASVVYVIDRSGSMGNQGRLGRARREVLNSLQHLPPTARFQVIVYNRHTESLPVAGGNDLVPATPENKARAAVFLEGLPPEGGTEHFPALRRALTLAPEVVYFLTDADDLHPDQVRALTQLNHGRATIHTFELNAAHRADADQPLHVLARDNRGQYWQVSGE